MSAIRFEDYCLSEISYLINENFDEETDIIDLTPNIEMGIDRDRSERAIYSKLKVSLGSLDNTQSAFIVTVSINGKFFYDEPEIESYDVEFDDFVSESTIAILWSFIRPMISDMITRANVYPNYILPVVNVKKIIKENGIQIKDI